MKRLIQRYLIGFSCMTLLMTTVFAESVVPFELINGLIVVEAEVNGERGNYIIDSGSDGILLNGRRSSESSEYFETLNGAVEANEESIELLRLGAIEQKDLSGFVIDLSAVENYLNKDLSGILGGYIFDPYLIIIDYNKNQIKLSTDGIESQKLNSTNILPFLMHEKLPVAIVEFNGKRFNFLLDSGASAHFVDQSIVDSSPENMVATGRSKTIVTATNALSTSKEYILSQEFLGMPSFKAYTKNFENLSKEVNLKIHGIISLNALSADVVVLDSSAGRLYY